jgi:hypothetical protein
LRRRPGGRGYKKYLIAGKGLICFQYFQKGKLRQMEKVYLACGQCGILKMTGRTGTVSV